MKCIRDGLKHLSDVLEKIQLFDLEEILFLKIHCSTGVVMFEYRQCRDADANFVSVFTTSFSLHVWKT